MVGDLAEYHDTVVGEGGVAARTTAAGQGIEARNRGKESRQGIEARNRGKESRQGIEARRNNQTTKQTTHTCPTKTSIYP
jgi:hypothetical protein